MAEWSPLLRTVVERLYRIYSTPIIHQIRNFINQFLP